MSLLDDALKARRRPSKGWTPGDDDVELFLAWCRDTVTIRACAHAWNVSVQHASSRLAQCARRYVLEIEHRPGVVSSFDPPKDEGG